MSPANHDSAKRRGVPGFVVVIAGVLGLNLLASYSMEAALALAGATIVVAAILFLASVFRKH